MNKIDYDDINKTRMRLHNIVYNDCLPTNLVTNSLSDICSQYDNYMKACRQHNNKEKKESLDAIRFDINMINRQNINSGKSNIILSPNGISDEDILHMGKTIATIYAIPHRAGLYTDYIGYAYGIASVKLNARPEIYNTYEADKYIDNCSDIMLHAQIGSQQSRMNAKKVWELINESISSFKELENAMECCSEYSIEDKYAELMTSIKRLDNEIEAMYGKRPQHNESYNNTGAQIIALSMSKASEYSNVLKIEEMRQKGVFLRNAPDSLSM